MVPELRDFARQLGNDFRVECRVINLENETSIRRWTRLQQPPKRLDHSPRIFPCRARTEIEKIKNREAVLRNPEVRFIQVCRHVRLASIAKAENWHRDRALQGLLYVRGGCPNFVETIELLRPFGWEPRQFPRRRQHVVASPKKAGLPFFDLWQRVLHLGSVEMKNPNAVGNPVDAAMAHLGKYRAIRHVAVNVIDGGPH